MIYELQYSIKPENNEKREWYFLTKDDKLEDFTYRMVKAINNLREGFEYKFRIERRLDDRSGLHTTEFD